MCLLKPLRCRAVLLASCVWLLGAWGGKAERSDMRVCIEDLSVHRIPPKDVPLGQQLAPSKESPSEFVPPAPPPEPVTKSLDQALQERAVYVREHPSTVQGYTLQVYMGSNRGTALAVKRRVEELFPALDPKVHYDLPHYAVRIGQYLSKIEAFDTYTQLKPRWRDTIVRPTAFVLKEFTERIVSNENNLPQVSGLYEEKVQ